MDPLVLSVLYVWCQINKDTIVTFWFGMQFKVNINYIKHIYNVSVQSMFIFQVELSLN